MQSAAEYNLMTQAGNCAAAVNYDGEENQRKSAVEHPFMTP